ncbi:MAG: glycosyltransferase family 4 protein [Polyangiales bacterium]
MSSEFVPNALSAAGPVGARGRNDRPRFAVVAPYLPCPADSGGRIRIAALGRGLARRGEVELFARAWPVEFLGSSSRRDEALAHCARWQTFSRDLPSGLPGWDPWRARDATPRVLLRALRARHDARPFDAVVACHAYAAAALRCAPGALLVLDEHNVESRYARDVLRAPLREWGAMRRFERAAWRGADLVTCVRGDDVALVRRHTRAAVALVPNGVELDALAWRPPSRREGREVIFVGAMSHGPNVEAAVFLAREVLPRLRVEHPDARLLLCGRAPDAAVRALAGEGVTVTGTVDRTAPFLDRASVFANALRAGEGTSLKVLEAAAAGLPLVSTPEGARGFELRDGDSLLVARSADEFVRAIASVWRDPEAADARAQRAREVASAHRWSHIADDFAGRVCALLGAA